MGAHTRMKHAEHVICGRSLEGGNTVPQRGGDTEAQLGSRPQFGMAPTPTPGLHQA